VYIFYYSYKAIAACYYQSEGEGEGIGHTGHRHSWAQVWGLWYNVGGDMKQVVSLSGGKDSTAMLLMMLERGEPVDDIVFFDWGMEFPQMYEHLYKLEAYIDRPITRIYPEKPYEYYMFDHVKTKGKRIGQCGYGWPGNQGRWCTGIKRDVLNKHNGDSVNCIGYSYQERFSRAGYKNNHRYPLLEWGVAEIEALKFCRSHGFDWGGLYDLFRRVSCWCCPLVPKREAIALRDNFPELWARLEEWHERCPYPLPKGYTMGQLLRGDI